MIERDLAQALVVLAVEAGVDADALMVHLIQHAARAGETFLAIVGALELLEDHNSDLTTRLRGAVNRYGEGLTASQRARLGLPPAAGD